MGKAILALLSATQQGCSISLLRSHVRCDTLHLTFDTDELGVFETIGEMA